MPNPAFLQNERQKVPYTLNVFSKGMKMVLRLRSPVIPLLMSIALLKHHLRLLLLVKLHMRTRITHRFASNLIHRNCRNYRPGIIFV
jgi:hypothetical protein